MQLYLRLTLAILPLLILTGCKFDLGLKVHDRPGACNSSLSGRMANRAIAVRKLHLSDCENIASYQFDVSRFSPKFDTDSSDREWVQLEVDFADRSHTVQAEDIRFSTKAAVTADPLGYESFPRSYEYSEFRASLSAAPEVAGSSENSLSDALAAAYRLCEKKALENK